MNWIRAEVNLVEFEICQKNCSQNGPQTLYEVKITIELSHYDADGFVHMYLQAFATIMMICALSLIDFAYNNQSCIIGAWSIIPVKQLFLMSLNCIFG